MSLALAGLRVPGRADPRPGLRRQDVSRLLGRLAAVAGLDTSSWPTQFGIENP